MVRLDPKFHTRFARLFAYRDSLSKKELADCLPPSVRAALTGAGVLRETNGRTRSVLRLMPFAGLLILSDEMDAAGDPVMGPGATTLELARMLRCEPGERVLDVGCGAGTLALVAAKQGASSVGVDIHSRAIEFSQLNARLNGLTARFFAGDLLEPVRDRLFDLVVSQPPFVITPPGVETTTYLHGGQRGHELAFRLMAELSPALSPNGRAMVLFDTPLHGEHLRKSVSNAVGDVPPSSQLTLSSPGHDADTASLGYAAVRHPELGAEYASAAADYRQHLKSLSIERLQHALVFVWRLREDEPQLSASLRVPGLSGWSADTLGQLRDAARLAALPDGALVRHTIAIAPDCSIVEERRLGSTGPGRVVARFAQRRFSDRELSEAALIVIDSVRRSARLDDVVEHFAAAASATRSEVQSRVLTFVRESLVGGLLVPSSVGRD